MRASTPLIAECNTNLECRIADTRLVKRYKFFVQEVSKDWIDTSTNIPRMQHPRGKGVDMVAGEIVKLASKMK